MDTRNQATGLLPPEGDVSLGRLFNAIVKFFNHVLLKLRSLLKYFLISCGMTGPLQREILPWSDSPQFVFQISISISIRNCGTGKVIAVDYVCGRAREEVDARVKGLACAGGISD